MRANENRDDGPAASLVPPLPKLAPLQHPQHELRKRKGHYSEMTFLRIVISLYPIHGA